MDSQIGCPTSDFLGTAAGSQRGWVALGAAGFFEIELGVRGGEKFFDALAVAVVDGDADAGGELRSLRVAGHDGADAVGDALGFFVQGLGQAIATTSNTAAVLSPFGGAAYSTHLNLNQQLGVAAGAAAGQIGAVLNQAAPKGPTVSLEANVAVGVMFLSNVTMHRGS